MFCAISSFVTMFSKSLLLQRRQKASIWGKGLKLKYHGQTNTEVIPVCFTAIQVEQICWKNPTISSFLLLNQNVLTCFIGVICHFKFISWKQFTYLQSLGKPTSTSLGNVPCSRTLHHDWCQNGSNPGHPRSTSPMKSTCSWWILQHQNYILKSYICSSDDPRLSHETNDWSTYHWNIPWDKWLKYIPLKYPMR